MNYVEDDAAEVKRRQLEDICKLLLEWHGQGKVLPGYRPTYGRPHLYKLLGVSDTEYQGMELGYAYGLYPHMHVLLPLLGPHGWTVYKMLLAKQGMSDACG